MARTRSATVPTRHVPTRPARPRHLPEGRRIYAIGDIHGHDGTLAALLDHLAADSARRSPAAVTLVYLGDYVDRGPNSAGVLATVATTPPWVAEVVALAGNHERLLTDFLEHPSTGKAWGGVGGYETLASFGVDIERLRADRQYVGAHRVFTAAFRPHVALLGRLQPHYSVGDYYFCHAGVRPGIPLELQDTRDLLWIRDEFLDSPLDHGKIVVHGHTPVDEPELLFNRVNVDTGAYFTGRLTALAIEPHELRLLTVDADGQLTQTGAAVTA